MAKIHLRIITPKKIVREDEVTSVTVPGREGEMTILPHHINLFSLLNEGIVKIKKDQEEDYLSIGGGYIQTDGQEVNVLVSKAYGQDQIDEKMTKEAIENARVLVKEAKTHEERIEAISLLRRSSIDLKLLRHRRSKPSM